MAHSEGLEIFDVEWKIGKQRLLRVYIDRLPDPEHPDAAGGAVHSEVTAVTSGELRPGWIES